MKLAIKMTAEDFDRLTENAAKFSEHKWAPERFQPTPAPDWAAIYWVGESWASVMLVRSFLQALGQKYEVVSDEAQHPNGQFLGWVILTNYISAHPGVH